MQRQLLFFARYCIQETIQLSVRPAQKSLPGISDSTILMETS